MKFIVTLLLIFLVTTASCRGKKTENKKPLVEEKEQVENEFGNEDSLLKYQTPPVISNRAKDSLLIKKDN